MRWADAPRFLLVILASLVYFSLSAFGQTATDKPNEPAMHEALSEMTVRINRAAQGAESVRRVAPVYAQARREMEGGKRDAAIRSLRSVQDSLRQQNVEVAETPLLRSFSADLEAILASVNASSKDEAMRRSSLLLPDASEPAIQQFVAYFQNKGRQFLDNSWRRAIPYKSSMETILVRHGLPASLVYVGLVESGFNPLAVSEKKARGIWQFIPATAKRFGLRQDAQIDERTSPMKSTLAAAEYLKLLYAKFGDWYLALAAYNAGENRVQAVIDKTGVDDFWEMRRRDLLPRETLDYVPAVLAAIAISNHPARYGFFEQADRVALDSPPVE